MGVARVSDLFFFFQNNSSLKKSLILRGWGKGGLASVSEFVFTKNSDLKKQEKIFFLLFWGVGWD